MNKIAYSLAALVLTAGSALAADLPSRKAAPMLPPPPPPPLWNGFYAGLNAGYNFGTNANANSQNWVAPLANGVVSNAQDGFMGGAQIGYNYQWSNNILIGVETDIQGTNTRGTGSVQGITTVGGAQGAVPVPAVTTLGSTRVQAGLDFLGTVRGRVGYLWNPTLLLYGTAGFAYGGAYANVDQVGGNSLNQLWVGGGRQNQFLTGWTAGGGAEWMFMPNWSVKAEALYWELGNMNVQTAAFNPVANAVAFGNTNVNYAGITARAGINYHFSWGAAPIVAKY